MFSSDSKSEITFGEAFSFGIRGTQNEADQGSTEGIPKMIFVMEK
jgi:hypothetical protein